MIENTNDALILFVEDEQCDDGVLRPSTMIGWELEANGSVYPVTPMSGVVRGGWAIYDARLQSGYGHTTGKTQVTMEGMKKWVKENVDGCDGDCGSCPTGDKPTGKETLQ